MKNKFAFSLVFQDTSADGEINLKFVKSPRRDHTVRRVRAGYSARRYLGNLAKSFDDSVLGKLTSRGS